MIIQQQAINKRKQEQEIQNVVAEDHTVRKRKDDSDLKIIVRKLKGRGRAKVEPVSLVPRTIEEAPLRRMDRRALNALRKRRADKHMIAFLIFFGILGLAAGIAAVIVWNQFRFDYKFIGLLIIIGPIMILTGVSFIVCSLELVLRLSKQIR